MTDARTIRRILVVATIATLASAGAASADPAEAVQEAERMLEMMQSRFQQGIADEADVARARYAVLDAKFGAKAISVTEFCRSAKPQLALVAARLNVGDEEVDEKAKWLKSIAAMDTNPAKCQEARASAEILLFDAPRYNGSEASLKQAQAAVKLAEDRDKRGLANDLDIAQAQYQLLVAQYRARKIDRAGYCASAIPLLQRIVVMFRQRLSSGILSATDVFPAERRLYAAQAQCKGVAGPRGAPQ